MYDPARVDLARVLCPPYDVISPRQQAAYYERDPHNAIRIVLSRGDGDRRYANAAADFRAWLAEGTLRREPRPAMYVHRHTFDAPVGAGVATLTRTGLIAAVGVEPWDSGAIRPHEHTMPGPKEDRLRLLRATGADTEPIWVFHPDPDGGMGDRLEAITSRAADLRATFVPAPPGPEAEGVGDTEPAETHEVWRVDDVAAVADLAAIAGAAQLYIADGHHRYETALFHAAEVGGRGDDPTRFKVMLLSRAEDPGLLLRPTHRMLRVAPDRMHQAFAALLERGWTSEDAADLADLERRLAPRAAPGRIGFGVYAGGRFGYMEGSLDAAAPTSASRPDAAAQLEVARIHADVLEPLLGIGPDQLARGEVVSYERDAAEVVRLVDAGDFIMGMLLRPPTLDQVVAVADAGQSMPQKSTYFWPKPASGLLMAVQEPGGAL
jgi:uncharacterized protein (DUF1015 family)